MDVATPYRVEAFNLSRTSENRIHDPDFARKYGFEGDLVPGVEVYAYGCHAIVDRYGPDWLARGEATCRFMKPVYGGRIAEIGWREVADGIAVDVASDGVHCAAMTARLPDRAEAPEADEIVASPAPQTKPPADETSLAVGVVLTEGVQEITAQVAADYLEAVRESDPLYRRECLVHPGLILRLCNKPLMESVALGPWIHVGSRVRNFAAARVGDTLSVRARVTGNAERKGHHIVDYDARVLANDHRVVAQVDHTAIYRLRGD